MSAAETWKLRAWLHARIPLLAYLRPAVVALDARRCVIRVPLSRRSKNHLGSMYFGALCAGADLAGALMAFRAVERSGRNVSIIFKDVRAEFKKRPEADVVFTCEDGGAIAALVTRTIETGEREELTVRIAATVPEKLGEEPVAEFRLTLSLKLRGQSAAPPA